MNFESMLQQRLPFLQKIEELLAERTVVFSDDLPPHLGAVVTPKSLQHVGQQLVDVAKSDWTDAEALQNTIIPYAIEVIEFWEAVHRRHDAAREVFARSQQRPYCLFLRSFNTVAVPIEVPGGRVVAYSNDGSLDANFASSLQAESAWLNPVTCLHTDDMGLLARSEGHMPAFRVLTSNWKVILAEAIASASCIVLYVDTDGPGVEFERDRIREHGQEQRTVLVHRTKAAPTGAYAAALPVTAFLKTTQTRPGPQDLSAESRSLLRRLLSTHGTRPPASKHLTALRCHIVDSALDGDVLESSAETTFVVTASNVAAFVGYVEQFPDSLLMWNKMSQDMRLRGLQPRLDDFNELYVSLRMALACAACLGFTSSVAALIGLLCKVASMPKRSEQENQARIAHYMKLLDIALRFDALTNTRCWSEKIEAFRDSILNDPYM
jgi:hypothetical protein